MSAARARARRRAQALRRARRSSAAWTCASQRGERHALIGPNGAGKSVLFHLISARFPPSAGRIALHGEAITGRAARDQPPRPRAQLPGDQPLPSPDASSRTCAARCCGRWATATRSGGRADRLPTPTSAPREIVERIGLAARAEAPAGILSYAEQRALEIGITIAGGAEGDPARRAHRGHEPHRDRGRRRADPPRDRGPHAGHRRARHERGVRPRRPHLGAGVRPGDRHRHARPRSAPIRRCARPTSGAPPMLEVRDLQRLVRQEPHPARRGPRRARGRDREPARAQRRRAARPP